MKNIVASIKKRANYLFKNQGKKQQKELYVVEAGESLGKYSLEAESYHGPKELREIGEEFEPSDSINLIDNKVPLIWWVNEINFGDLLSPWLISKLSRKDIVYGKNYPESYLGIGSILRYANNDSVVWGAGSFGPEPKSQIQPEAQYLAVRGPLTRSKIIDFGGFCEDVYGDPALIVPMIYWPKIKKKNDYGLVFRWSEHKYRSLQSKEGVKIIDLGSRNIEKTIKETLSCKLIASTSLHGLILADAYGIPNAWLAAEADLGGSRPKGGEFKFIDYFMSVKKCRDPQKLTIKENTPIPELLNYDSRAISFNYRRLLNTCPFLKLK